MDELEFYNGAYTGAQVDEGIGKALAISLRGYYTQSSVTIPGNNTTTEVTRVDVGAGDYIICAQLEWSDATSPVAVINVNNSNVALSGNTTVCFCVPITLTGSTTIKLYVYHATSTSKNIIRVSFAVVKIG